MGSAVLGGGSWGKGARACVSDCDDTNRGGSNVFGKKTFVCGNLTMTDKKCVGLWVAFFLPASPHKNSPWMRLILERIGGGFPSDFVEPRAAGEDNRREGGEWTVMSGSVLRACIEREREILFKT